MIIMVYKKKAADKMDLVRWVVEWMGGWVDWKEGGCGDLVTVFPSSQHSKTPTLPHKN